MAADEMMRTCKQLIREKTHCIRDSVEFFISAVLLKGVFQQLPQRFTIQSDAWYGPIFKSNEYGNFK